jgi:Alphavirus glycoprotein J
MRRHRGRRKLDLIGAASTNGRPPLNLATPDATPAEIDAASVGLSGVVGPLGYLLAIAITIGAILRRLGRRAVR